MNWKIVGILIAIVVSCSCAKWAVLVAGSNTWSNYRHQADVFHAYRMLIAKGFDPTKIIVMAYNDIANDTRNKFPGKVFNKPSNSQVGKDVYAGVRIDYQTKDVIPAVFLAVLEGNKAAVEGKGTGRVLETTPQDNVFVFFSDHGAVNLIAFPNNQYLYADQLLATFKKIEGKFSKFVFYLQTCQSGSMFVNLPAGLKIYALSAANPSQSSWATYCPPDDVIEGQHLATCLGDLFSVSFIQNCDNEDITKETLQVQFEKVKTLTKSSHVMQWGDTSYTSLAVSEFIGSAKAQKHLLHLKRPFPKLGLRGRQSEYIDSRLMKIKLLTWNYKMNKTAENERQMIEQMRSMQRLDDIFFNLAQKLQLTGHSSPELANYDCQRAVIDNHIQQCGQFSDYGLSFIKYYAEACQSIPAHVIIEALQC